MVKSTRYAVVADRVTTSERLLLEPVEGAVVFDVTLNAYAAYRDGGWQIFNDSNSVGTGWAQYKDNQYTSGSPLVVSASSTTTIDNNSASTITSHLPTGVVSFYDNTSSRITPESVGDAYLLRIDFTAYTSSPSGLAKIKIDIGDGITPNVIVERGFTFPKGTGSGNAQDYSTTTMLYSLSTFLANGALIQIESLTGTTSIYDVNFVITRVHKA